MPSLTATARPMDIDVLAGGAQARHAVHFFKPCTILGRFTANRRILAMCLAAFEPRQFHEEREPQCPGRYAAWRA